MSWNLITKKIIPILLTLIIVVSVLAPSTVGADSHEAEVPTGPPEYRLDCGGLFKGLNFNCVGAQVSMAALKSIGGSSLALTGLVLDFSIKKTVIEGNKYYDSEGVKAGWKILRDLANIFFIFILLFIGISTILQSTKFGYKAVLKNLIIMALLVNFSFFVTQVVIDVSNVASVEIYEAIGSEDGISKTFKNQLRLSTVFEDNGFQAEIDNNDDKGKAVYGKIMTIGIFGTLLFFVIAFIFMATAILFVSRVVVLSFVLVTSPLAFAALVLPGTLKWFQHWFKALIANAFFAPIYLMGVFLSLEILKVIGEDSGEASFAQALISGDSPSMGIVLDFMIIAGFMVASLIVAKQLGAVGATGTLNLGKKIVKGTAGGLARQTVGRFGAGVAATGRLVKTVPLVGGLVGAPLTTIGNLAAEAKYGSDKSYRETKKEGITAKVKEAEDLKKDVDNLTPGVLKKLKLGDKAKRAYGKRVLPGFIVPGGTETREEILKTTEDRKYTKEVDSAEKEYVTEIENEKTVLKETFKKDPEFEKEVNSEMSKGGETKELNELNESLQKLIKLEKRELKQGRTKKSREHTANRIKIEKEMANIQTLAIHRVIENKIEVLDAEERSSSSDTSAILHEKRALKRQKQKIDRAASVRNQTQNEYLNQIREPLPSEVETPNK